MSNHRGWSDKRMDSVIGNLLRAGVLFSAAIVALGAAVYLYGMATRPPIIACSTASLQTFGGSAALFVMRSPCGEGASSRSDCCCSSQPRLLASLSRSLDLQRSTIACMSSSHQSCSWFYYIAW